MLNLMPKSPSQNLITWFAVLLIYLTLSFLSTVSIQLSNTPDNEPLNWRPIIINIANDLVTIIPVVAAGLGLPALGKEQVKFPTAGVDLDDLARRILDEKERRDNDKQKVRSLLSTSNTTVP